MNLRLLYKLKLFLPVQNLSLELNSHDQNFGVVLGGLDCRTP
jgi:hypothetical protein